MQKLMVFNHQTLDGYFVDAHGSMQWAKTDSQDPEWQAWVDQNASGDGTLLFGRKTYEMMNSYWPTPMAAKHTPLVAERMNKLRKVVFSRTLDQATWNNTRLVKTDMLEEVRRMKAERGEGLCVLGSGTIVSQLAQAGLIDEYQVVMNPLILGNGRTMFDGMQRKLPLKLARWRGFNNGYVALVYEPAA